jgi:hypothetical protein
MGSYQKKRWYVCDLLRSPSIVGSPPLRSRSSEESASISTAVGTLASAAIHEHPLVSVLLARGSNTGWPNKTGSLNPGGIGHRTEREIGGRRVPISA